MKPLHVGGREAERLQVLPFRIVERPFEDDLIVVDLLDSGSDQVTPDAKRRLAGVLLTDEITAAGRTPLSTCMVRLAASLAESFLAGEPALEFPMLRLPLDPAEAADGADA